MNENDIISFAISSDENPAESWTDYVSIKLVNLLSFDASKITCIVYHPFLSQYGEDEAV